MGKQIQIVATDNDICELVDRTLYPDMKIIDRYFNEYESVRHFLQSTASQYKSCYIVAPESRFPAGNAPWRVLNGECIAVSTSRCIKDHDGHQCFTRERIWVQTALLATEDGEIVGSGFHPSKPVVVNYVPLNPKMMRQYMRMYRYVRKNGKYVNSFVYVLPEADQLMNEHQIRIAYN